MKISVITNINTQKQSNPNASFCASKKVPSRIISVLDYAATELNGIKERIIANDPLMERLDRIDKYFNDPKNIEKIKISQQESADITRSFAVNKTIEDTFGPRYGI